MRIEYLIIKKLLTKYGIKKKTKKLSYNIVLTRKKNF